MSPRAIPRTFLGGYLKLIRLPLDTAVRLLPGNGAGPRATAEVALDRIDALTRSIAGTLLVDPVLREDAQRRGAAASERQRAARLRSQAQTTTEEADERVEKRERQASRRRKQARVSARRQSERAALRWRSRLRRG